MPSSTKVIECLLGALFISSIAFAAYVGAINNDYSSLIILLLVIINGIMLKRKGFSILYEHLSSDKYSEIWMSGGLIIGGVSKCLNLRITDSHIILNPHFPFNILIPYFLMSRKIPLEAIKEIKPLTLGMGIYWESKGKVKFYRIHSQNPNAIYEHANLSKT